MNIINIKVQYLFNQLQLPTQKELSLYIKSHSKVPLLFLIPQLLEVNPWNDFSFKQIKIYLKDFTQALFSAAKQTYAQEEFEWYIFYLLTRASKDNKMLSLNFSFLPKLETDNHTLKFFEYNIYLSMLDIYSQLNVSKDLMNSLAQRIINYPKEFRHL